MNEEQNKINKLIIEADEEIQKGLFSEGFSKFENAKKLAMDINWDERIGQIENMIKDVQKKIEKDKEFQVKKAKYREEMKKKREHESKLEAARKRAKNKDVLARNKKIEDFKKKKEQDEKISNLAYDLLGLGSTELKKNNFEKAIESYESALNHFKSIKWSAEILRIKELIIDTKTKFEAYNNKLEKEKQEKENLKYELEAQEDLIRKSQE